MKFLCPTVRVPIRDDGLSVGKRTPAERVRQRNKYASKLDDPHHT
jgi:hypothetical protein